MVQGFDTCCLSLNDMGRRRWSALSTCNALRLVLSLRAALSKLTPIVVLAGALPAPRRQVPPPLGDWQVPLALSCFTVPAVLTRDRIHRKHHPAPPIQYLAQPDCSLPQPRVREMPAVHPQADHAAARECSAVLRERPRHALEALPPPRHPREHPPPRHRHHAGLFGPPMARPSRGFLQLAQIPCSAMCGDRTVQFHGAGPRRGGTSHRIWCPGCSWVDDPPAIPRMANDLESVDV